MDLCMADAKKVKLFPGFYKGFSVLKMGEKGKARATGNKNKELL